MNAKASLTVYIGEDPEVLLEELRTIGEARARLSAKVSMFDHRRKIMFARNMVEFRYKQGTDGTIEKRLSDSECEAISLNQPNYIDMLTAHAKELEQFNILDAEYWRLKAKFDYLLSVARFAQTERGV